MFLFKHTVFDILGRSIFFVWCFSFPFHSWATLPLNNQFILGVCFFFFVFFNQGQGHKSRKWHLLMQGGFERALILIIIFILLLCSLWTLESCCRFASRQKHTGSPFRFHSSACTGSAGCSPAKSRGETELRRQITRGRKQHANRTGRTCAVCRRTRETTACLLSANISGRRSLKGWFAVP